MASRLLEQPDVELLTLSRKPSSGLTGPRLTQWALDLAQPLQAAARLESWLAELDPRAYATVTLINNAALMPPLAPIDHNEAAVLADTIRVGLEAPLLLTASFLRATRSWSAARRVLNISSGLARRPMAGCAPYGAVKAGLDNFSRIIALDEANAVNGAKVVALAPGVIDTDMQTEMRNADAANFPERERVAQMKEKGLLDTPETAADKVLNYLERADFGANVLADVRQNEMQAAAAVRGGQS